MKSFKKITAIILTVVLVLSMVGCSAKPISLSPEWSYKNQDKELSIGVYIYSLYSAYNQANKFAQENEKYKEDESFLNLEITDEDGNTAKAEDWIYKEAKEIVNSILSVHSEVVKREITIPQSQIDLAGENAKSDWELGPYASYYAQMGYAATPYKTIFEPFGISYDSFFESAYYTGLEQAELFKSLYDKGGTEEVSDKDLIAFFEENYTDYSFFSIDLKKAIMDEDGEEDYEPMTDDEVKDVKAKLDGYAKEINENKKSFEDIVKKYQKDNSIETDPSTSNTEILDNNTNLDETLKTSLKDLKENTAKVIKVGNDEDESAAYYLIYKGKIKDATADHMKDEEQRYSTLTAMKTEDFSKYVKQLSDKVEVEENTSAVKKYKLTMFEDFSSAKNKQIG